MEYERQHPVDRFVLKSMGSTLLLVGCKQPSAEGMRWLEQQLVAFGSKHGGRGTYLHYAFDGGDKSIPDEATRAAMKSLAEAAPKKLAAIAMVVDYEGFMGAATRGVLAGVLMAARAPKHLKIFSSVGEGRAWLSAHTTLDVPDADAIAAEVKRIRAMLEAETTIASASARA